MSSTTYPTPIDTIQALERRIAEAAADCEAWRRTGNTEKYVEAYDLVEALQKDLQQRTPGPR